MAGRLTDKQQRFADEYLVDLNATQAAIRAGYSQKTAAAIGAENLTKPEIADVISARQSEIASKLEITQERIASELAKIGFSDIRKVAKWFSQTNVAQVDDIQGEVDDGTVRFAVANQVEMISSDEIDDDTAAAISEVSMTDKGSLKVKLHDKRAALVDLGKHLGMFKEQVEHSGSVTVELVRFSPE